MKRMRLIGVSFIVIMLFGVVAASASAAEILFSSATGTFETTGGEKTLTGTSQVTCSTTNILAAIETAHLGKMGIMLETCRTVLLGVHVCTGTKPVAPSGEVFVEAPFHLNTARKTSTETAHAAVLLLYTPTVEFACSGVGVVKVSGNLVGLLQTKAGAALEPPAELLHSVLAFQASGKTQNHKEFLLGLTIPVEELMTKQELGCEIFGITGECSLSSSSEITKATPAGIHLITG